MNEGHGEKGIGRRDFFKTVIGGAAALGLSGAFPGVPKMVRSARAAQPGNFDGCRLVVFGSDSLRFDYAQTLVNDPLYDAPAITSLNDINPIICSSAGNFSCTQPGWATIWTGVPSYWHRAYANLEYEEMPQHMHIMRKLAGAYLDQDLYLAWITGKGKSIAAKKRKLYKGTPEERVVRGPHWQVKQKIAGEGHPGVYLGDEGRENIDVYEAARDALIEARDHHENFCCFIHFKDPDHIGHLETNYDSYMAKAVEVDNYIMDLMDLLPQDTTDIIYCSDHGFDFADWGDTSNHHNWSPHGMLATNFTLPNYQPRIDMCSVGRLIYRMAGGDPDHAKYRVPETDNMRTHRMHGVDLV